MDMLIGTDAAGNKVKLDPADLLTHGIVLGRTGSGKTGATVTVIEEAVMAGASAIVIDPKGDLTNLALAFPGLTAEEFAPWVQPGMDPKKVAANARAQLGELAPNVALWKAAADVTVYAPGKLQGGGKPVNILPSFEPPAVESRTVLRDRAASVVTSILGAIGHDADPLTDPANVYLTDLVYTSWSNGAAMPLEQWASALADPPASKQKIDGLDLEDFFPKSARLKIARALVGFRRQATRWLEGTPLNIASFVGQGKPKVSVFTLRHLDEGDRMFFTSMLLAALVDFMFQAPASDRLRLLVVLDEAKGYLPPYPLNPPTKKPICTLLAQGRAQGIGVMIGTQNPNDIDYKALSNVGTWLLGNLRERDCARDLETELQLRGVDPATLATVPTRHFLLLKKSGETALTKIRWTYSYLRGPINAEDLDRLDQPTKALVFSGDVAMTTFLRDPQSRNVRARLVYKIADRPWRHATMRWTAEQLRTTPDGVPHTLVWDSLRDIGNTAAEALLAVEILGYEGEPAVYTEPSVVLVDNRKALT